ncbi:MAG: DUF2232 domain-containing protein [Gemmatimonadota bacterium]
MQEASKEKEGGRPGLRALALLIPAVVLAVGNPLVAILIPFVVLCVLAPGRSLLPIVTAGVLLAILLSAHAPGGFWYAERGWALLAGGGFAAATLMRPEAPFFPRALVAVFAAVVAGAVAIALIPGGWGVLDWLVTERLVSGTAVALEAMRLMQGAEALSPALEEAVVRTVEVQGMLFPALLGLATLASLGVAWWLYVRMVVGRADALGPLGELRFGHHWIWLFIGGLLLVLLGGEGVVSRVGTNAALFMAALYALRGLAVVVFLKGGVTGLWVLLLAVGFLFLAPMLLAAAFLVGLGDSWFDLRQRQQLDGRES